MLIFLQSTNQTPASLGGSCVVMPCGNCLEMNHQSVPHSLASHSSQPSQPLQLRLYWQSISSESKNSLSLQSCQVSKLWLMFKIGIRVTVQLLTDYHDIHVTDIERYLVWYLLSMTLQLVRDLSVFNIFKSSIFIEKLSDEFLQLYSHSHFVKRKFWDFLTN